MQKKYRKEEFHRELKKGLFAEHFFMSCPKFTAEPKGY